MSPEHFGSHCQLLIFTLTMTQINAIVTNFGIHEWAISTLDNVTRYEQSEFYPKFNIVN
jgi:hypothetical protein